MPNPWAAVSMSSIHAGGRWAARPGPFYRSCDKQRLEWLRREAQRRPGARRPKELLLGWLRPRRLHQFWKAGHSGGFGRLEGKLLRQESDAVTSGLRIQSMRRLIEFEFFWLTHDSKVLPGQSGTAEGLIGCVLQENGRRCSVGYILAGICPGIPGQEGIEFFRSHLPPVILVNPRLPISLVGETAGHKYECLKPFIDSA